MARLIVTLPLESPHASTELDYVLTLDNQTLARHGRATLATLPWKAAEALDLVAVVPARTLSWHRIKLPPSLSPTAHRKRVASSVLLRSALDGLLEEHLLDVPDRLHLALSPDLEADGSHWVAACDKDWLQTRLQPFAQAGRPIHQLVPEFEPLDAGRRPEVHVIAIDGQAHLAHVSNTSVNLLPAGPEAARWLHWPDDAPVLAEPSVAPQAEALFQHPVTLHPASQRMMQASTSRWDLAQFDLAEPHRDPLLRRLARLWQALRSSPQWQPARWLLVSLAFIHVIGLNAVAWRENSRIQDERTQLNALFKASFPSVPVIIDAPLQMAREMDLLRQATGAPGPSDLDQLLGLLARSSAGETAPAAIDFNGQQLKLGVWSPSANTVAALQLQLRARGQVLQREGSDWLISAESQP